MHPSIPPKPEHPRTAQVMAPKTANSKVGRKKSWARSVRFRRVTEAIYTCRRLHKPSAMATGRYCKQGRKCEACSNKTDCSDGTRGRGSLCTARLFPKVSL